MILGEKSADDNPREQRGKDVQPAEMYLYIPNKK